MENFETIAPDVRPKDAGETSTLTAGADTPLGFSAAARTRSEPIATRVVGLDALRFVAAVWVVLSHVGAPPLSSELANLGAWGFLFRAAWGILFSGPAAVIVFFVISGFCIHYPYAAQDHLPVIPYLLRRYIRIGIPMLAAMAAAAAVGLDQNYFFYGILWSLVAELIYYTVYPAVRMIRSRYGIRRLIISSYMLAFLVPLTNLGVPGYAMFGWQLNWLLGLPCWLLGVQLADWWTTRGPSESSLGDTWKWRAYVWAVSSFCLALNHHSPLSYAWTLNIFALVAFEWIRREIVAATTSGQHWKLLERAGRWSYSLYLCHMPASALYNQLVVDTALPSLVDWTGRVAFMLIASYGFYLAIESPSHRLARFLARRVRVAL